MPPACTRFTFAPLITSQACIWPAASLFWTLAACPLSCTAPLCTFFWGMEKAYMSINHCQSQASQQS